MIQPQNQVGAPLQGKLSAILAREGDRVQAGDPLFVVEAMKMESTVSAPRDGKVKAVILSAGTMVDQNDLVLELD
ncbi:MAG: biotin/lipoyl-binding protein [Taibaiella sp.]|nr:biotin/lipoyl-binding protein [Taibaiella sp.]